MAGFNTVRNENERPTHGQPGDIYYHRKELFIAMPDGRLTPVNRLLSDVYSLGIMLARGPQGDPGANGKDSMVPGPKGERGEQGPRGQKGEPGDITVVGDAELLAAVNKLKAQKAAALAKIAEVLSARPTHAAQLARLHLLAVKKALEQ